MGIQRKFEKGEVCCTDSPTLNEEWIKKVLGEVACKNESYDEVIVRDRIEKVLIFNKYIGIHYKDESKISFQFPKG